MQAQTIEHVIYFDVSNRVLVCCAGVFFLDREEAAFLSCLLVTKNNIAGKRLLKAYVWSERHPQYSDDMLNVVASRVQYILAEMKQPLRLESSAIYGYFLCIDGELKVKLI